MNINDRVISIIGCIVSSLSLVLGVIVLFNDRLVGGIVLTGASLVVFLSVFIFYTKRNLLAGIEKSIVEKCHQKLEETISIYSGKQPATTTGLNLSPKENTLCALFYTKLDYNELTSLSIFAHTGADLLEPLFFLFNESDPKKNPFKQISIRILLRNPYAEIGRRASRINQNVERIREYQRTGFNKLFLQFYEDLPTFRAIICTHKPPNDQTRSAFLSFYYFPFRDSFSRRFPGALVVDEKKIGTYYLLDIYESWFNYFWGKNETEEQHINTLILDFDDTIVNSHDIQVEAWMELIEKVQNEYNFSPEGFTKDIRAVIKDKNALEARVKAIFFEKQDANLIFPEIFSRLSPDKTNDFHQLRFEIRKNKVRQERDSLHLFPKFMDTIIDLSKKYNLIIVSATDEDMITDYLSAQPLPANALEGKINLYQLFRYVFGKQAPAFDWKNMKRKSQLIIKIINILGIPLKRMVYVGDNNGDFTAAKDIGIRFVEARLFEKDLLASIGKKSLISDQNDRLYFTDWQQFPDKLAEIESQEGTVVD